jgi:hypothetical protein
MDVDDHAPDPKEIATAEKAAARLQRAEDEA